MSWETRGSATKYFTRSIRVGGRVVREYYGRGPLADIIAYEFARESDRLGRSKRWQEHRAYLAENDKLLIKFCDLADLLLRASLLAVGYHSHRGAWRRRKTGFRNDVIDPPRVLPTLMHLAGQGNIPAIEALQKMLKDDLAIWQSAADQVPKIEAAWLAPASRKDPASSGQLPERLATLRVQTSSPAPTSIDLVLVERVALTWLEAQTCEFLAAPNPRMHVPETIRQLLGRFQQKAEQRHRRARKRLLLARQKLNIEGRGANLE